MHSNSRASAWTIIALLSLSFTQARVANPVGNLRKRIALAACGQDETWDYINGRDDKVVFCHQWNSSPNATTTTSFTSVTTSTDISTTYVLTQYQASRSHVTLTVTPTSTVYVTERPAKLRRAPAPTEKAYLKRRSVQLDSVDAIVNAFLADNSTIPSNSSAATTAPAYQSQLFSDISSACSCHAYFWTPLYTDLVTETAPASTRVFGGYTRTTYTSDVQLAASSRTTSVSAVTVTSTVTLSNSAASAASVVSSISAATSFVPTSNVPFGVNFTCPKDHNTEQVIVHGSDTFYYRIYCGTSFTNETAIWTRTLASHSDCLGACASYNELANAFACKGTSFNGVSCTLFSGADIDNLSNSTVSDSAVLERALAQGRNFTLQNRIIGSDEASRVSSSLISETMLQTVISPPASITANATGYSACSTTTFYSSADGMLYASSTCSWSSAWWSAWSASATTIYASTKVIRQSGSIGGGSIEGSSGGEAGGNAGGPASVSAIATAIATAAGTGGVWASSWASNYTETFVSTVIDVSSGVTGGAESGANGGLTGIGGGASSGATGGATGGLSPMPSSWEANSTIVLGSTDIVVSAGATGGASSGALGGLSPIPAPSSWASNWSNETTIIGTSVNIDVSAGATGGATSGGFGGVSPIPAPSSAWSSSRSNETTIVETSVGVDVSAGATSGAASGGTGGISPLPTGSWNETMISAGSTGIMATGDATSGASFGGTGGISPIPFPTSSSWGNYTIIESVTTVIDVSASATSGLVTGGSGGLSPLPNATISEGPSASVPAFPGNTTVIIDTTTTVEEDNSFNPSRTQAPRSGSQAPPAYSWSGNETFPAPTGTGVSTEGSPVTAAPSASSPRGYGEWSSDDDAWSRSKTRGGRSGAQSSPSSGLAEETASSGFPVPFPNSTITSVEASGTGVVSYPAWNGTIPFPESSTTTSAEDVRTSILGELYYPSSTPVDETGTGGLPSETYNGTWSPSRTQGPRSGTAVPSTIINGTLVEPSATSSGCATVTVTFEKTITETVYASSCPSCPATPSGHGGYGSGPDSGSDGPPQWVKDKWANKGASSAGMSPLPYTSSSASPSPSSAVASGSRFRRAGQNATTEQVNAACNSVGNQIYNGEFEILVPAQDYPSGWGLATTSPNNTQFLTITNSTQSQKTPSGRSLGRVILSAKNATARISQPLTLCPGIMYHFAVWTKVLRPLARCEASFKLNDAGVGVVMPTFEWSTGIARSRNYTAEFAEVDLSIDIRCQGQTSKTAVGSIDFDDLVLEEVFS